MRGEGCQVIVTAVRRSATELASRSPSRSLPPIESVGRRGAARGICAGSITYLSSPRAHDGGATFRRIAPRAKRACGRGAGSKERGGSGVDVVYILIIVALYGASHWIVRAISRLEGES
jgi:hypothetical protein